jgi:hypothetical protein
MPLVYYGAYGKGGGVKDYSRKTGKWMTEDAFRVEEEGPGMVGVGEIID